MKYNVAVVGATGAVPVVGGVNGLEMVEGNGFGSSILEIIF